MDDKKDFVLQGDTLVKYRGQEENVTVPAGVTKIGEHAFEDNRHLVTVSIPDGVIEICDNAFAGCRRLLEVVLPDSVKEIGAFAFADCLNLWRVRLGRGVEEIGFGAFDTCPALLQAEVLSETVKRLGYDTLREAFYGAAVFTVVELTKKGK